MCSNSQRLNHTSSPTFSLLQLQTPDKIIIPDRSNHETNEEEEEQSGGRKEEEEEEEERRRKQKAAQLVRLLDKQRGMVGVAGIGLGGHIAREVSFKARNYKG